MYKAVKYNNGLFENVVTKMEVFLISHLPTIISSIYTMFSIWGSRRKFLSTMDINYILLCHFVCPVFLTFSISCTFCRKLIIVFVLYCVVCLQCIFCKGGLIKKIYIYIYIYTDRSD